MNVDTIVAIATPPGRGGVGIVRLSGPLSYSIACQLTKDTALVPRTVHYRSFFASDGECLDQGLVLYFNAPFSFTGEDVVEIQGHGSPVVLDRLLCECISLGARIAKPGEYSERAFLNDKIDLTQAEAIADIIHSNSLAAARMAMRSLQGDFSRTINEISEALIQLRLYVEAAIDFPEEDIDFLNDGHVLSHLKSIRDSLERIRASAFQGVLMREGISVVIAGRPNAGKSTLINALSGRDVAIVTDVPGTTRDVMRESVLLDDIPLHVIDTAGLRDSDDLVEKEGIKRAWQEVSRADCVLLVIDAGCGADTTLLSDAIQAVLPIGVPIIQAFNKIDTLGYSAKIESNAVYLSAKSGEGLSLLKDKIKDVVGYQPAEGQFLARRRHIQALETAQSLLLAGHHQLSAHRAGELLAEDLRLAHQALCEITGEFTPDDLLGEIFSSFCIGK